MISGPTVAEAVIEADNRLAGAPHQGVTVDLGADCKIAALFSEHQSGLHVHLYQRFDFADIGCGARDVEVVHPL